ncbi:APC family permease [Streptomyces formicae]|uniref:APC family permease n=1 Tax=Streptomyces formicae TaxID=1616117 RepID=A0ABY3WV03_9ACTN|nr:APC family permease [Streptomyces formicae]UNM15386.1 APC family permease [Streptomyces formicae]
MADDVTDTLPSPPPPPPSAHTGEGPGELRHNAIGFLDALVIGINSTSPAYSLAAVVGPVVALVGIYAPGVVLASFVPMLLIASAFFYLNRVDQDCGTTFSWVTRAMGPWAGWIGGWAIMMTGVLVVGSLADVAVGFGLLTVGLDSWAQNHVVRQLLAVLLILVMTAVCVVGTEASAHVQNALILAQVASLLAFAVVALYRVYSGTSTLGAVEPEIGWLNPFGAGGAALTGGLLLGVFMYWGWESAVNLTEEVKNSASAPGRAGIWSTIILLGTYLSVGIAVVAFAGPAYLAENAGEEEFIFALLAGQVLGGWDWLVLFAVSTSALASTQTTIIPSSRTGLSMARRGALPAVFARIHPRFRTPHVSTWTVAVVAIVWYLVVSRISENALLDSLTALSLLIAFYYALTGIACAVYYRRHLTESVRNFVLIGVGPVVGAGLLLWLLAESVIGMSDPAHSYSGVSWLGLGPPLVIGIFIVIVGLLIMVGRRLTTGAFWRERPSVADPDLVHGRVAHGSREL